MQIDEANTLIVSGLQKWVDDVGFEESGALGFYDVRLKRAKIYAKAERVVLEHSREYFSDEDLLFELGCGFGQLPAMLALDGKNAVGIEQMPQRFQGAQALLASLTDERPELSSKLRFLMTDFPNGFDINTFESRGKKVLLITNLVARKVKEREKELIEEFRMFDDLVIDLSRFGYAREEDEQEQLHRRFLENQYTYQSTLLKEKNCHLVHFTVPPLEKEKSGFFSSLLSLFSKKNLQQGRLS